MGTLIGHVGPGFGFMLIGLWHLFNNIKFYTLSPKSFVSSPWFPVSKLRYLELYLIIMGTITSISMELFIGPERHQPLDNDGTIPSNHLHNFEHSNISLTFLIYALFSILLDKLSSPAKLSLTYFLGSVAFGQMLLLFHLHSSDHMGVEGQYHWLLQIIIFISLLTTLLGVYSPKSFLIGFVRAVSVFFQGVWLVVMGFMLWTPAFIPKDCFMNLEDGHKVVRCNGVVALERAKSLVNIGFSWCVVGVIAFSMTLHLILSTTLHGDEIRYGALDEFDFDRDSYDVVEEQKHLHGSSSGRKSFLEIGKSTFGAMDIER